MAALVTVGNKFFGAEWFTFILVVLTVKSLFIARTSALELGEPKFSPKLSSRETPASKECLDAMAVLQEALLQGQPWALQMLDSTGKLPDGLLYGSSWSPGIPQECLATKIPANRPSPSNIRSTSTEEQPPPFQPMYCQITLYVPNKPESNETDEGLTLGDLLPPGTSFINGLCVPNVCTTIDIFEIMNEFLGQYGLNAALPASCYQKLDLPPPAPYQTAVMAIMCLFVMFTVAGTLFDVARRMSARAEKENQPQSKLKQTVLAFSMVRNTKSLLNISSGKGTIGCLNGIRVLSLSWIVLGHAYGSITDAPYFVNNPRKFLEFFSSWTIMPILSANVSVDTFFTMSGILVSYLLLKELLKNEGRFRVVHYYVHRYVRLTPLYAFTIGFYTCVFPRLSVTPTSLLFFRDAAGGAPLFCIDWWAYLLYIDNLFTEPFYCFGQSWYLPNDMQMYAFAPLVIVPLYYLSKKGRLGRAASHGYLLLLILASLTISLGILHEYHIWGTISTAGLLGMRSNPPRIGGDGNALYYTKPWCRFGPYVVGIYTGYLIFLFKDKRPKIPAWIVFYFWAFTVAMGLAIVYGLVDYMVWRDSDPSTLHPLSKELDLVYSGIHRLAWSIGVAWVVLACHWGYGGPVNSFLSWAMFQPLSKLSYGVYLVHTLVNLWIICMRWTPYSIDNAAQAADFLGSWMMSFMIAYGLAMVFEFPILGLEKVVFRKK